METDERPRSGGYTAWFLFPRLGLAVGAAPKTGCTTVLAHLDALEQGETSHLTVLPSPRYSASLIHTHVGRYRVGRDLGRLVGIPKVVVVRDPLERLLSAWVDKLLSWSSTSVSYLHLEWFPRNIDGVQSLERAFSAFIQALSSEDLREGNAHWAPFTPQYAGVAPDVSIRTERLSELPEILASMGILPQSLASERLTSMNASGVHVRALLSRGGYAWQLPEAYKQDRQAYTQAPEGAPGSRAGREPGDFSDDRWVRSWVEQLRFRALASTGVLVEQYQELQRAADRLRVDLENRSRELDNAQNEVTYRRRQVQDLENERQRFLK